MNPQPHSGGMIPCMLESPAWQVGHLSAGVAKFLYADITFVNDSLDDSIPLLCGPVCIG